MSDIDIGIISGVVGAVAGGFTGFLASRFSSYLDNKGKIIIKPYNEKLEYQSWATYGFINSPEGFNNHVTQIKFSFTLEIRNTSKIRKDYKDGKLIIRTYTLPDESELIFDDKDKVFQHAMMEPLECNIIRLSSTIDSNIFMDLLGKKVEFYVTITDSKDNITEVLAGTYDNF